MDTTLATLQGLDLPTVSAVVLVGAALALVVLDPVAGRRSYRAFLTRLETDPAARVRFYRRWTRQGWLLGTAVVAVVLALPGVAPGDLGLRLPDPSGLHGAPSVLVGGLIGLGIVAVAGFLLRHRLPADPRPAPHPMHPVTAADRRGWAWLSLSAGVTEEVTFRGLVVLALATVLPGTDPAVVVVVGAAAFGLAHWYQGVLGMVSTGILGAILVSLYLGTGSLLIPMVVHVLIDLAVLARLAPVTEPEPA